MLDSFKPELTAVDEREPEDPVAVAGQLDGLVPTGVEEGSIGAGLDPRGQPDVDGGLRGHHMHTHQLSS